MKKKMQLILMTIALFCLILCACGNSESELNDPTELIIGSWSNEEYGVVTEFKEDGTYTTSQYGGVILSDRYTAEKIDNSSIVITTGEGETFEVVFTDENTITSEDATLIRVVQNEYIPEAEGTEDVFVAPETLIIGKWVLDNASIEFDEDGYVYIYEDGEESTYTYELATIDERSITLTIIDVDGSASSETAVFYDYDTLNIGDTTFSRAA